MHGLAVRGYRLSTRIIKIQIFCLLALILALPSGVWAKPTTPEQARTVVENWLALDAAPMGVPLGRQITASPEQAGTDADTWPGSDTAPLGTPPGPQIKEVITYSHQDLPAYYVVYLNPAGFVIVAADDLVEPIIGFLPQGQYDPSPDNPLGAMVSQDLPGRVLDARQKEKQVQTEGLRLAPTDVYGAAKRKWDLLSKPPTGTEAAELGVPTISSVWVAPLVQSTWSQSLVSGSACYNYYTPPNAAGSASNYVCGCVATAMAQLMRFWQHPTTGVGTGSYTIYVDGTTTTRSLRGGDGAGGAYVWGSMPLVPNSSMTTAQRQAIGALSADAGVSVNMNYTSSSSGTDTLKASTALVNTFGYSNAKNSYNSGSNIPVANRNNMVNPNLDAGYPTLLGITGSPGGHAIVCDGYGYNSATLYHHLNLGWSGSSDAWYNLPIIDTSSGTFDVQYKIVYNVYKTGSGEIISGRVTDSSQAPISGVTVTATGTGGPFTATTNAKGIYALPKVPSGAALSLTASKTGYTFTPHPQAVTTGTSTNLTTATGNKWGINFTGSGTPTPTPTHVIYNNGPYINSPGTGPGGTDESLLQSTSLGMSTLGFGGQLSAGNRLADDFTLTSSARIRKIKFYAYQTGSTTTSTMTAVNLRIWNGPPNNPGSSIVFGDTTTNRMTATNWANAYRVSETTRDTQRPVMVNTVSLDVTLGPGTYWLDWQTDGSLASGPWAPPITKNGQTTTGNALQYLSSSGSWAAALDGGTNTPPQGFPFIIEGEGGGDISPIFLLLLN
jgi:hypothetical protein